MMHVEPGQVAAVRFTVEGLVGGRPRIVMEHVNRLTSAAAPTGPSHRRADRASTGRGHGSPGVESTPISVVTASTTTTPA